MPECNLGCLAVHVNARREPVGLIDLQDLPKVKLI